MSDEIAEVKNKATIIFVLGLLSVITCQILGPVAIIMGNSYMKECVALGIEPDGLAKAGRILGIVGTVLFGLSLVIAALYFVFIAVIIASGGL